MNGVAAEIRCCGLWKIYGKNATAALDAARKENLDKQQIQDRFGCVVGVRDASFSVEKGEIFCIMGLSGSGKSTLLRHVNRLIEPTAGEVYVSDVRVDRMGERALLALRARSLGMVFQHMALWPHKTVLENVAFGIEIQGVAPEKRKSIAYATLQSVGLEKWCDRYPDQLSGGMQQRVGLARALAIGSEILLMDEPFSALDPLIRRELQDLFLQLSARLKKTTLFITHDLEEAIRMGHRIAMMRDGEIVQVGTPEQIILHPANDYVARFVKDVSRLNVVRAGSIASKCESVPPTAVRVKEDATLLTLLDYFTTDTSLIVVERRDGTACGVVTLAAALKAIRGQEIV